LPCVGALRTSGLCPVGPSSRLQEISGPASERRHGGSTAPERTVSTTATSTAEGAARDSGSQPQTPRFSSKLLTRYPAHEFCAWFHCGFGCISARLYLAHKDARRRPQRRGIFDNALGAICRSERYGVSARSPISSRPAGIRDRSGELFVSTIRTACRFLRLGNTSACTVQAVSWDGGQGAMGWNATAGRSDLLQTR